MARSVGPSLGWQLAHWIETLLCHGPGDIEGTPIELDAEWLAALVRMYEFDARTGRRTVDSYTLSRPKGRAKSELAGFTVCAEGLGPVRFDHWAARGETSWWGYEYETGEPVGAPPTYPFVRCLATEESQTGNTYDVVQYVLTEARIAEEFPRLDVGLTRTFLPGGGEIRPSTAGAASKDGGKETFAVADEIHLYVLPEHRRMYNTVSRNLTKRKGAEPWMLKTTTQYQPGEDSVAELEHVALQAGPVKGLVLDHREGPEPRNWNDDRQLRKSLRIAYGEAAAWMDLDRIIREIRRPTTSRAEAMRYFLNRLAPVVNDGWLKDHPRALDACYAPELTLEDCDRAVGFVDMSLKHDSTAVGWVGLHGETGRTVVRCKIFTAPPAGKVDFQDVRQEIRDGALRWQATSIVYDPRFLELIAQELEDEGLPMIEFPQSPERMNPACGHLLELIVGGDLAHDGSPDLVAHIVAAVKRPTGDRGFTLSKGKSKQPIDACVGLAMGAYELAQPVSVAKEPNIW